MRFAMTTLAVMAAALCAASSAAAQPTEQAPNAPAMVGAQVPSAPAGKAQVVFFRPSKLKGMAMSFSIREGDKAVGKLNNGSYFVVLFDPGPHEFTVQAESKDTLRMELEAGETHYVQQSMDIGIVMTRSYLTPSDANEFARLKLKAKRPASDAE